MIEAGTKSAPFDVVIVHSFSRFFRDHFELEFYVRKLAKNGVRLVSITQEMGDDPMHVMMRQIMALFDEYQSKENAKHVLRPLKEGDLLRTLVTASGVKSATPGVRSSVRSWRRGWDGKPPGFQGSEMPYFLGLRGHVVRDILLGAVLGVDVPDTRWLMQHAQGWYAVQDVPRSLRAVLGKKRLVVSLRTRDLRVAQARRHDALAEFARVITAAKRQRPADPLVEVGLRWRQALEADRSQDTLAAAGLEADYVAYKYGEAAADQFSDIALGEATPLLHHVESWLAEGGTKGPLRPRTQVQFRSDLARLADWLSEVGLPVTLEAVTSSVTSRYVTEALLGQGVHRVTGNRQISACSSFWRWMIKRAGLRENPWKGQSLSKSTRTAGRTKRPFTEAEVITLLTGPADAELADAMRVAALTGARLEEIYRLQVRDCQGGWFDIRESKTAAGVRRVPIHTDLAALVARRVAGKAPTAFLFQEADLAARSGRKRIAWERSSAVSKRFGRYRQALGVHDREEGRRHSRVDFHSWRRWFVTEARRAGIDRAVVAAVVGHETGSITDDVYSGGPGAAQLRACVEAVRLPGMD